MRGSGCDSCQILGRRCSGSASTYRGSRCAALRTEKGLGDPETYYDRLHTADVKRLAEMLVSLRLDVARLENSTVEKIEAAEEIETWLMQPADLEKESV